MYAEILKEKFPQDEKNGLYRVPNLPAIKLGRILIRDKRIASPSDVIAMHLLSGTFSSATLLFTENTCYYEDGSFLIEDIKEVQMSGNKLIVFSNQQAQFLQHTLRTKNDQVAHTLKRILEILSRHDPTAEKVVKQSYEGYSNTELDCEEKKEELLSRL